MILIKRVYIYVRFPERYSIALAGHMSYPGSMHIRRVAITRMEGDWLFYDALSKRLKTNDSY